MLCFYKIDWEDIRVNNLDDFKPKITMYNIDDEINLIDTNEARDDYNTMISIADRHYKEICKNLLKMKDSDGNLDNRFVSIRENYIR